MTQTIGRETEGFCRDLVTAFYNSMQHTGVSGLPYGDHLADDFARVSSGGLLENPAQSAENLAFSLLLDSNNDGEMSTTFAKHVLADLPQFTDEQAIGEIVEDLGGSSSVNKLLRKSTLVL